MIDAITGNIIFREKILKSGFNPTSKLSNKICEEIYKDKCNYENKNEF
jgi:hypothetical protein